MRDVENYTALTWTAKSKCPSAKQCAEYLYTIPEEREAEHLCLVQEKWSLPSDQCVEGTTNV